jgi:hypothetical protein
VGRTPSGLAKRWVWKLIVKLRFMNANEWAGLIYKLAVQFVGPRSMGQPSLAVGWDGDLG